MLKANAIAQQEPTSEMKAISEKMLQQEAETEQLVEDLMNLVSNLKPIVEYNEPKSPDETDPRYSGAITFLWDRVESTSETNFKLRTIKEHLQALIG